jgi:hypothetical protein
LWEKGGYMTTVEAIRPNIIQNGDVRSVTDEVIAHRSNDRYYLNSPWGVLTSPGKLNQAYRVAEWVIRTERNDVTRCVGRFLVSESVLAGIKDTPLARHLEVAIPTELRVDDPTWLVMFGMNHPSRRMLQPRNEMINQIVDDSNHPHPVPLDRMHDLIDHGYTFVDRIDPLHIDSIYGMWGKTFGWTRDGVLARSESMEEQGRRNPRERDMWFSGLVDPAGMLVSVALGERLNMEAGHGLGQLPLVEITEWRRGNEVKGHGFMAGAVAFLNAQILTDLEEISPRPLIFAETNYMSKAHRVGMAVGMEVPPYGVAGIPLIQVLEQNVNVGDGYEPEGLRDFTVEYVTSHWMKYLYPPLPIKAVVDQQRGRI